MKNLMNPAALAALALLMIPTLSDAQSAVNPKAARSVHLNYPAPEGTLFYNEVTVEKSVHGSYFMACGFQRGYFGIQELGDGQKVVLFSVWDPTTGNDPNAVKTQDQVEILSQGAGVEVSRFGGEGTGGKSLWHYAWKLGSTYKFLVSSKVEGEKTTFVGYFYVPEQHRWQQMATFRTRTGGAPLNNYYSFIEDFRRDGASAEQIRRARFGNGWIKTMTGDWVALRRARFTADGNTQMHINSGVSGDSFYLQNGGATKNVTPLLTILERPLAGLDLPDLAQ
ncbi:MAG: DUF3472 domain-containing protein [Armatimonadota bacterium]|nr:DUF3472 domain-containing protein [Armatimonadota bacterium]